MHRLHVGHGGGDPLEWVRAVDDGGHLPRPNQLSQSLEPIGRRGAFRNLDPDLGATCCELGPHEKSERADNSPRARHPAAGEDKRASMTGSTPEVIETPVADEVEHDVVLLRRLCEVGDAVVDDPLGAQIMCKVDVALADDGTRPDGRPIVRAARVRTSRPVRPACWAGASRRTPTSRPGLGRSAKRRPMIWATPEVGDVRPTMMRIVVDWPAPFGPRKPVTRRGVRGRSRSQPKGGSP